MTITLRYYTNRVLLFFSFKCFDSCPLVMLTWFFIYLLVYFKYFKVRKPTFLYYHPCLFTKSSVRLKIAYSSRISEERKNGLGKISKFLLYYYVKSKTNIYIYIYIYTNTHTHTHTRHTHIYIYIYVCVRVRVCVCVCVYIYNIYIYIVCFALNIIVK